MSCDDAGRPLAPGACSSALLSSCQGAFNLKRDVPTCTAARDGTCLTAAQETAIAPIFSGATTSTGAAVYSSFPYDAGLGAGGTAFWEFTAPLMLDSGAVGFAGVKVPFRPTLSSTASVAVGSARLNCAAFQHSLDRRARTASTRRPPP